MSNNESSGEWQDWAIKHMDEQAEAIVAICAERDAAQARAKEWCDLSMSTLNELRYNLAPGTTKDTDAPILAHNLRLERDAAQAALDAKNFLLEEAKKRDDAQNDFLRAMSDELSKAQAAHAALREAASFLIARVGMDAVVDGELSDYCYFCNGDAVWSRDTKSYKVYHEAGCVLMALRDALASHGVPAHTGETKEQA